MFALSELLILLSAVSKAFMDAVAHERLAHWGTWFDPKHSWRFKYKNDDPTLGEKFPLSTTLLVWTTDAWHFFQSIFLNSIFLLISLHFHYISDFLFLLSDFDKSLLNYIKYLKDHIYIEIFINFALIRLYFGVIFEWTYQYLRKE